MNLNEFKSELKLVESNILNTKISFHQEQVDTVNLKDLFEKYELDFDFVVQISPNGEHFIFTKIHINGGETRLSGYTIFVEAVSVFEFDSNCKLSEAEKDELILISGLSMAIHNLRMYISNATTYSPLGKFDLPALDVRAILDRKREEVNKKG